MIFARNIARVAFLVAGIFAVSVLAAGHALAEKRVALIIGNAGYQNASSLANPGNDASAIADSLERLDFAVVRGIDLGLMDMRRAVREFSQKLDGADVALFYYAGHGMQVFGENYLIPVDAELKDEADLDFSALKIDLVLRQMDREPRVKIVILDACRDNPFETQLARSMGATRSTRALGSGLAEINPAGGTMIAFATDPGDVALDGTGKHSPFTEALLKHIETPGLEVNVMMTRVRGEVFRTTGERQRPWTNTSLTGEFYLADEPEPVEVASLPEPAATQPSFDERQIELALWNAVAGSGEIEDYQAYLAQYPRGVFATVARNRIEALETAAAPAVEEPTSPEPVEDGRALKVNPAAVASPPEAPAVQPSTGGVAAPAQPARPADPEPAPVPPADHAALEKDIALSRTERRAVQRRLTLLGYSTRGVDGIFGAGTRSAVTNWQNDAGMQATGYLTVETHARLINQSRDVYANWQAQEDQRRQARARAEAEERARRAKAERDAATAVAPAQPAPQPTTHPAPQPTTGSTATVHPGASPPVATVPLPQRDGGGFTLRLGGSGAKVQVGEEGGLLDTLLGQ